VAPARGGQPQGPSARAVTGRLAGTATARRRARSTARSATASCTLPPPRGRRPTSTTAACAAGATQTRAATVGPRPAGAATGFFGRTQRRPRGAPPFPASREPHVACASALTSPLPYKVDTSRPSLRTNWTRLVAPRGRRVLLRKGQGRVRDLPRRRRRVRAPAALQRGPREADAREWPADARGSRGGGCGSAARKARGVGAEGGGGGGRCGGGAISCT
jgi:hypothetical protein